MKKLLTTNITSTAAMPIKSGTLDHLQAAYTELIIGTVQALLGQLYSFSTPIAIYRVDNTQTPPDYTIIAGWILYEGVLYETSGPAFTVVGPQVAVGTITTTYLTAANADPVTFTDATTHNVHEIKKVVFAAGATGSGDFDYDDIVFLKIALNADSQVTPASLWDFGTGTGVALQKNQQGLVTISGVMFADGTPGIVDPMFVLPVGYRPPVTVALPCVVQQDSTSDMFAGVITISSTTGEVIVASSDIGVNFADDDKIYINLSFYNS